MTIEVKEAVKRKAIVALWDAGWTKESIAVAVGESEEYIEDCIIGKQYFGLVEYRVE